MLNYIKLLEKPAPVELEEYGVGEPYDLVVLPLGDNKIAVKTLSDHDIVFTFDEIETLYNYIQSLKTS